MAAWSTLSKDLGSKRGKSYLPDCAIKLAGARFHSSHPDIQDDRKNVEGDY